MPWTNHWSRAAFRYTARSESDVQGGPARSYIHHIDFCMSLSIVRSAQRHPRKKSKERIFWRIGNCEKRKESWIEKKIIDRGCEMSSHTNCTPLLVRVRAFVYYSALKHCHYWKPRCSSTCSGKPILTMCSSRFFFSLFRCGRKTLVLARTSEQGSHRFPAALESPEAMLLFSVRIHEIWHRSSNRSPIVVPGEWCRSILSFCQVTHDRLLRVHVVQGWSDQSSHLSTSHISYPLPWNWRGVGFLGG